MLHTTMAIPPSNLRYTDTHQWVRPDETLLTSGITEAAIAEIGTIGFVELPYPGELFKTGDLIGRISGGVLSAPLRMPLTGQINAVNQEVAGAAGPVNDDPYGAGWLVRIEPGDPAAVHELMDAAAYAAFLAAGEEQQPES